MRRRIPFPTDFPHSTPVDVSYVPRKRSPSAFLSGSPREEFSQAVSRKRRAADSGTSLSLPNLSGRTLETFEGEYIPPVTVVTRTGAAVLEPVSQSPDPSANSINASYAPPRGRVIRFVRRNPQVVAVSSRSPSPFRSPSPSYAGPPLLDGAFSRFGATALATGDQVRFLAYEFYHGSRDYAESMFERFKRRNNGRVRGFVHRRMEREVRYVKIPWGMSLERFLHSNYDLSSHSFHDYQSYILPTYQRWR